MPELLDYDAGPIRSWRDSVQRRGGHPLATGYPFEPFKGAPAAWWWDDTVAGRKRWELAPVPVRLAVGYEKGKDRVQLAAGAAAEKAEEVIRDTGLDKGVFGLVGKVFGVPPALLMGVVIIAGVVVGYAALVQIGLVPPVRQLVQKP